jgi:hypothetical protein
MQLYEKNYEAIIAIILAFAAAAAFVSSTIVIKFLNDGEMIFSVWFWNGINPILELIRNE